MKMKDILSWKWPNNGYLYLKTALLTRWDWRAILLSFLTACTFWFFQSLNTDHTAVIRVPISLSYDPTRFVLLKDAPDFMEVQATGYGWDLLRAYFGIGLEPIEIKAPHRMFGRVGMQPLMPVIAYRMPDLHIAQLVSDSLEFQLDTLVVKYVPVQIPEKDVPLSEHIRLASNIIVAPSQIALKGPASILSLPMYQQSVSVRFPEGAQINDDYDGWLAVDIRQNPYIAMEERVKVRFKVARFSLQTVRAKLVLENFPEKHDLRIEPDSALVQYWLMEGHEPTVAGATVVLDYRKINWSDSLVAPQIRLSTKFVEPSVQPKMFNIRKRGAPK